VNTNHQRPRRVDVSRAERKILYEEKYLPKNRRWSFPFLKLLLSGTHTSAELVTGTRTPTAELLDTGTATEKPKMISQLELSLSEQDA